MASHRKPKQRTLVRATVRTAATLAVAGAASATALADTGEAAPGPEPGRVRAEAAELYRQAEQATESYDGAKEQADAARERLDGLTDQLARRTERLNQARDRFGTLAAARYRAGGIDPAVQLILSTRPDRYLEGVSLLDRVAGTQAATLRELVAQRRQAKQLRDRAAGQRAELAEAEARLAAAKQTIDSKVEGARRLLRQLPADRSNGRSDMPDGPVSAVGDLAHAVLAAPTGRAATNLATAAAPATSLRATRAVSFAFAQLGKAYAWGASGPDAYDCSGLAQAAWRAAGVSLPRTTYSQINSGRRISRSQLRPGDLVFFYSGISHVGIYVGGGMMIHAPHPGASVRLAPVDEMPFAGATRPA